MNITKKKFIVFVIIAFLVGAVLTGGVEALVISHNTDANVKKYEMLCNLIDKYYYEDYDIDAISEESYAALVDGLGDKYASYLNEDDYAAWIVEAEGEYCGVGITFGQTEDGDFVIASVQDDSPADKAGLQMGDVILSVNDKTYETSNEMSTEIRGDEGTKVKVKYSRDGEENTVTMTREEISIESVYSEVLDDNIGYIYIDSFISGTADDFAEALQNMEDKKVDGLILDLRYNGGGLVDSAIDVVDNFLDGGVVATMEGRGIKSKVYKATEGKTDLKTVVLVNGSTASSSELVAAAMKDNGYKIVGTKTYGKGVIQNTIGLSDGTGIKLTVAQYLSPDGSEINGNGVKPDYVVENTSTSEDLQFKMGQKVLKEME